MTGEVWREEIRLDLERADLLYQSSPDLPTDLGVYSPDFALEGNRVIDVLYRPREEEISRASSFAFSSDWDVYVVGHHDVVGVTRLPPEERHRIIEVV